ncbi:MAG: tRNA pseudouridine(55) synthase TruB [Elusimicrobia bacterium]|nr:tRNA pseudouridine(55) synthase TruB [Elusimicrobiota bacterium]
MTLSGLVLFDKPQGWTSHDAVDAFRRALPHGTKVGHCGTLDPLATGLLILLVGEATRMQSKLQGLDKVYSGAIRLGVKTDTGDITGKVLEQKEAPPLTLALLQKMLDAHLGELAMPAPAYSAVKHKGVPLYKYARRGVPVPEKPRTCTVRSWKALSWESPDLTHVLSCSSGTYVRSLAESLGDRLGCGGTVATLRRESIAGFEVVDAMTLEALKGATAAVLRQSVEAGLARLAAA